MLFSGTASATGATIGCDAGLPGRATNHQASPPNDITTASASPAIRQFRRNPAVILNGGTAIFGNFKGRSGLPTSSS